MKCDEKDSSKRISSINLDLMHNTLGPFYLHVVKTVKVFTI